jgi:hypothetical protein
MCYNIGTEQERSSKKRKNEAKEMKAIDKVTKREHAICSVLGGYQVCLIPDMDWEDAKFSDIHVFLNEQFEDRFELV